MLYIYNTSLLLSITSTMECSSQAVQVRLAVRPGVLIGVAHYLAVRPAVLIELHLEITWSPLGVHLEAT